MNGRGLRGLPRSTCREALLKECRFKQQVSGVTDGVKQVSEYAAVEAIRSGEERIARSLLTSWRGAFGYGR